jgi:tetratricopeptide (TPR) repeat protein
MSESPDMTPDSWEQIATCFEAALLVPVAEQRALVAARLPDNPDAQREVLDMLAASTGARALGIEPRLLATDTSDDHLATGTRLGAWRVAELIGRGGMGEVYRAERVDGGFAQPVAIKVLRAGLDHRETVRRFEAERQILARLDHPHIVAIIDGGNTDDGRPFLVMPHVDGVPITDHCDQRQLGLAARLQLFIDVANAVQYAHTRLIVHRDIKPSNIFVTTDGAVRLLDFGIAKLLAPTDGGSEGAAETQSAIRLLTPEHAAPEQVLGAPSTTATDVYGLGVLLYQLLTGTRPHAAAGRSMLELERDIVTATPPAPSSVTPRRPWTRLLRGDLDRIVLMALRKEADRRYASAGQLAEDVDRYLRGMPVRAERDSVGYRTRKFVQRHRAGVAGAAVGALMLIAFAINAVHQSRLVARERDVAQQERASAESAVSMLTALFARANPRIVPGGDTLRVEQLIDVAQAQVDSLADTPRLQARMRQVLGTIQLARGRSDLARAQLQQAYDQMLALPGSDSADIGRAGFELAHAIESYEGAAKALPLYELAVKRLRYALPDTANDVQIARRQLAQKLPDIAAQRRILEAQANAAGLAQVADTVERAGRLHGLAMQRLEAGDIIEATALFEESLRLIDLKLPRSHPDRMVVAGNVATTYFRGGQFELAASILRERLAARRAEHPVNNFEVASAHEAFASVQAVRGFLEEAERYERDALAQYRAILAPTSGSIALSFHNLALITASRGRTTEALAFSDSGLMVLRAGGADEADILSHRDVRGELLLRSDRLRDAAAELDAITARVESRWPPGHAKRVAHDVRRAILDLALDRPDSALARFDAVTAVLGTRVPPTYPFRVAARCGRAVALARLGRVDEVRSALADDCDRYRRYGIHVPQLVRWANDAAAGTAARTATRKG